MKGRAVTILLAACLVPPAALAQPAAPAPSAPAPSAAGPAPNSQAPNSQPGDNSHGEPVQLFWKSEEIYDRNAQTVTLTGGARAVRGDTTLDADTLIGYLRKKAPAPGTTPTATPAAAPVDSSNAEAGKSESQPGGDPLGGSQELYRIEARGHVHVFNESDQLWGDHGLYDMDQGVMVMTGRHLKASSPQDVVTARDVMEYHSHERMSVARGDAILTTNDGRQVRADVLVAFSVPDSPDQGGQPKNPPKPADQNRADQNRADQNRTGSPLGGSSHLDRAYGWGNVVLRTQTQTATGDRGVYVFATEIARLIGHVHVTQGQNQNNGSQAIVNMKTGIATMLPGGGAPIQGLVVPNEAGNGQQPGGPSSSGQRGKK